ncbi:hypothetical protein E1A91_A11G097200v1 [Gossypium mustelinum]|uniref:RlpA-like protein double-psi beta-barrel domain-containing protein n=1 Tax=Gossypium mustelinum TaxID=34275 RepID=A0A5D2X3W6_GOSMU|nr:hypothetical protein E1A91_A11G097200v1 [Gossypium mustelinum]
MKKQILFSVFEFIIFLCFHFLFFSLGIEAQTCDPSGTIPGTTPPPGQCNQDNNADCCVEGEVYTTYTCSPLVSDNTPATLTINSFQEGGDGGGASKCDNQYHSDNEPVVALSTGWFSQSSRCNKFININGNGKSVRALVVDECDSQVGCDDEHAYQPPCRNNIVDASKAVWTALGVPESEQGELDITWSDA